MSMITKKLKKKKKIDRHMQLMKKKNNQEQRQQQKISEKINIAYKHTNDHTVVATVDVD